MKTIHSLALTGMLALVALLAGCVVHEHSAACGHYYAGGRWYYAPHHVHGPGCGHFFSGGIWIVGP